MTEDYRGISKLLLWEFPSWEHIWDLIVLWDFASRKIVNSPCWRIGRKILLWEGKCVPVYYILDYLVKEPSQLWGGRTLEREEGSNTNCKWLASILKRTVSMREEVVCSLQRGSSDHRVWQVWNGPFQTRKERDGYTVEAGPGKRRSSMSGKPLTDGFRQEVGQLGVINVRQTQNGRFWVWKEPTVDWRGP